MNHLKVATVFLLLTLNCLKVQAQPSNEYKAEWAKIQKLENAGLVQDALTEVVKIFDAASKAGYDGQAIKAAMYQMKYRNIVQLDNRENNIFYIDTLIAQSKAPITNVLQSMQAELFHSYRQQNRYKLYGRTQLTAEVSSDITTWSINKLNATVESLYKASLQNEALLKRTPLNGLDAIIEKGKNSRHLRPTLYDFLAHRALDYFMNDENDVTQPAYSFIINDENAFAPVSQFVNTKFISRDTSSLYYNAIIILQNLLRFHQGDANKDALLDADLKRLAFVNDHAVFNDKSTLYINA
ncbi:MAG: alpha-2-macroglobulin, partial [Chitinophagaceae bacterium]